VEPVRALLLVVLLSTQPALALAAEPPMATPPSGVCLAAAPPCGYINPIIDLDFPTKPRCPGLPGSIEASQCIPLPPDGGSVTYAGTVRWYWKASEELIYPPDQDGTITISFGATATNPSWLTFATDPPKYEVTAADLLDPRNQRTEDSGGQVVQYYWFERPLNVTFTRTGGPSEAEWQRFEDRQGVQPLYVKAKSNSLGTFYMEAYGGEEFRFNATGLLAERALAAKQASGAPASLLAAALILALVVQAGGRRRRPA
jgi:hypothetical protein